MLQTINYELTINMQLKANIRSGSVDEMGTPPQIWFVVQSHVGGIPSLNAAGGNVDSCWCMIRQK